MSINIQIAKGHKEEVLFRCYKARDERKKFEAIRAEHSAQIVDNMKRMFILSNGSTYTLR